MPGGVYRIGLPRTDLKATLDGVALKPGFALGGWLAFEKIGDQGMVMGDVVLTEDEVNPVMAKLAAAGIQITALQAGARSGDPQHRPLDRLNCRWPAVRRLAAYA
jgi:hypothetical protein